MNSEGFLRVRGWGRPVFSAAKCLVPEVGLEPTWACARGILSPVRLPVSPLRRMPESLANPPIPRKRGFEITHLRLDGDAVRVALGAA